MCSTDMLHVLLPLAFSHYVNLMEMDAVHMRAIPKYFSAMNQKYFKPLIFFFFFLHCPFSPSVQHLRDLNADLVHGSLLSIKYSTLSTTLRGKYWTEIGLEFRHQQNCCLMFYILIIFHVFARTADTGVSSLLFTPLMIIFVIIVITKFFVLFITRGDI